MKFKIQNLKSKILSGESLSGESVNREKILIHSPIHPFTHSPLMFVFVFLIFTFAFAGTALAELTINANHNHIKIDFFYHGSNVSVSGTADPGSDLIVKIASPDGHEVLKQKGKVAGFLWMNVGTLSFEKTPALYSIHSTKNIADILSKEEMDRHVIGYPALEKHIEITPASKEKEKGRWFDEFVKYKESSNLYTSSLGKIVTDLKNSKQFYYIKTAWPYQAAPGDYIVTVYAVKDKKVTGMAETKVLVEQVGIINSLSSMAKNNGALYGVISIVIALGAGFGVSMIFKKGGGAH